MNNTQESRRAKRRTLALLSAAAAGAWTGSLNSLVQAQEKDVQRSVLRIGYQKYGTLTLLKGRGTLEKRLATQGIAEVDRVPGRPGAAGRAQRRQHRLRHGG